MLGSTGVNARRSISSKGLEAFLARHTEILEGNKEIISELVSKFSDELKLDLSTTVDELIEKMERIASSINVSGYRKLDSRLKHVGYFRFIDWLKHVSSICKGSVPNRVAPEPSILEDH